MKKTLLSLLVITITCFSAVAQKVAGTVKGMVHDSASAHPLGDATISVVNRKDSALVSFTLSEASGSFSIKNVDAGDYVLLVSYTGLQNNKKDFTITADKPEVNLGVIQMGPIYKTLDEIIITEAPVKINGDTISYRADAFKTKPNATVEDLLKKLPGMSVDKDGTVRSGGEQVQKVYVDGKQFFGNDPKIATKNLTADMVDRVETYDDMSEQAKFNGIDDGSRAKAINLKLKKDKKKGLFGKAYAGYGTDGRYDAGITANAFKGAMKTNIIAKANNTNNIGFTVNDIIGMLSSGNGGSMMGGSGLMGGGNMTVTGGGASGSFGGGGNSSGGLNLSTTGSGITSSAQAGINYSNTWNEKLDGSGSYFFNHAGTKNNRQSRRQTIGQDSTIITDGNTGSEAINNNHRFNFNLVYKLDSLNSFIYTPGLSFQQSEGYTDDTTAVYSRKGDAERRLNNSRNITSSTGDGYNWNNNLIWRKRFMKRGRTLSVNLSNTLADNNRDRYTIINSIRYIGNNTVKGNTNTLQTTAGSTNNYGISLSYTEPLARDKVLELNYSHNDNRNTSDRHTYNYNAAKGVYDGLVDSLTNDFKNTNLSDRVGANLRIVKRKYNYQLGFAVQQTQLESENLSKNTLISQKYLNLFPTAVFNYQFARSKSLRINYRGRTNQPSTTQLQEVTDVTNYPYLYKGNAALKQEFSNTVSLNYNFFNVLTFRNVFANLSFGNTQNKITNSVEQLGGGVQLTRPVNMNGNYNANANVNFGFPIKKLKGGNFNTTSRISYNRDASLINKLKNFTNNLSLGEDLRLSYSYKDKLDLGITTSISYNSVKYTVQQSNNANTDYFTHVYSADASYIFPKNFTLSTDFDYTFNTGLEQGFNRNYAIWNVSLGKQVFKNKRGEIKATVFDLLNQNQSVTRNVSSYYVEDVRNSVVRRYAMLTFTYNLNAMGGNFRMPAMFRGATRNMRIMP